MSVGSTDIWESHEAHPLLWMATASVALVAHLGMLQVGITAYQMQLPGPDAADAVETKIIATSLQIAGAKAPPPPQLEATPVAPTATPETNAASTESLQAQTLTPQTLSATATAVPVAEAVQTLTPMIATQPEPEPENPAPVEATTETIEALPDPSPAPESPSAPPLETTNIAPIAVTPQTPMNQPGVAPLAATPAPAPQAVRQPASLAPIAADQTLEVATLDAPVVEALPEPQPEPIQEATAEPISDPVPLPDLPNSLPAPPSDTAVDQPGVASPNAPEQSAEQAQETYDTVLDFLRSFNGGSCFAALPVLAEDGAFRFETFAKTRADLTRFRQALEIETGTLPGSVMKPVSDAQCRALPFVTAAARYPEFKLYFDLSARNIPSGETLSGRLGNTSGGFVSLLLIDDEGVVQDLGSFLKFRPGYAGFDIPMTLKGSPVQTQQLLMALSTNARLKTLSALSGQQAQDFFPKLALEILLQGGGEDVALVAFSVR